jgi:hypothetical protein
MLRTATVVPGHVVLTVPLLVQPICQALSSNNRLLLVRNRGTVQPPLALQLTSMFSISSRETTKAYKRLHPTTEELGKLVPIRPF